MTHKEITIRARNAGLPAIVCRVAVIIADTLSEEQALCFIESCRLEDEERKAQETLTN
jgi:hypothetical protein